LVGVGQGLVERGDDLGLTRFGEFVEAVEDG
jgi:hypothetical protein